MKKVIFSLLSFGLIASQSLFASQPQMLTSYNDISNALLRGHEVKAVFDFSQCTSTSSAKIKNLFDLQGGMNFKYYLDTVDPATGKKIIKSSTSLLYRSLATLSFYQLYAELEAYEDGSIHVYGAFVNPMTNVPVAEVNYQCHLSTADKEQGVKIFDLV